MAKANRVLSTPRRTASKTKVKKVAEPAVSETAEQRDQRLAEAFRELEQPIREVYYQAEITFAAAMGITTRRGDGEKNDILHFAVGHLCNAIFDLRNRYLADLHAGKEVT